MEDLTYAYVAFADNDTDIVYVMVCFDVLIENFDEFKTIHKMIPEMTMDYHDKFMIVNRMPKSMLSSFRTLMRMLAFNKCISVGADEQINFLLLLFRLGNMEQIKKFLELTNFRCDTWRSLMDINVDVKDFFSDEQKYRICLMMKKNYPEMDDVTYLSFYNVPFTKLTRDFMGTMTEPVRSAPLKKCKYDSTSEEQLPEIKELHFPRKRIYDKESDSYYQYEIFGEKVLLLRPRKATIAPPDTINEKRCVKINSRVGIPALDEEGIGYRIIENFIYGDVVVAHRDKLVTMQLIFSTADGAYNMFYHRIRNDCAEFVIPKFDAYIVHNVYNDICANMLKNGMYIRPTLESMIAQLEKMKVTYEGMISDEVICFTDDCN